MRILLIILLVLLCSCFRQSFKDSLDAKKQQVKQRPEHEYAVEDLGLVQAYLYTYKGKQRLFVLHGRKLRHSVKVDTVETYRNPFNVKY